MPIPARFIKIHTSLPYHLYARGKEIRPLTVKTEEVPHEETEYLVGEGHVALGFPHERQQLLGVVVALAGKTGQTMGIEERKIELPTPPDHEVHSRSNGLLKDIAHADKSLNGLRLSGNVDIYPVISQGAVPDHEGMSHEEELQPEMVVGAGIIRVIEATQPHDHLPPYQVARNVQTVSGHQVGYERDLPQTELTFGRSGLHALRCREKESVGLPLQDFQHPLHIYHTARQEAVIIMQHADPLAFGQCIEAVPVARHSQIGLVLIITQTGILIGGHQLFRLVAPLGIVVHDDNLHIVSVVLSQYAIQSFLERGSPFVGRDSHGDERVAFFIIATNQKGFHLSVLPKLVIGVKDFCKTLFHFVFVSGKI